MFEKIFEKRMTYDELNNYTWNGIGNTSVSNVDILKEATYNKCIRYNAEAIAKLSIDIKQTVDKGEVYVNHKNKDKLTLRANPYMTTADCMKAFIALGEHEGISCLWIDSKRNLYPAQVETIIIDDAGILKSKKNNPLAYILNVCGVKVSAFDYECIVYRSGLTFDGIHCNSNSSYLQDATDSVKYGSDYLKQLFSNGLTNKVVVQMTSDIQDKNEITKIQRRFDKLYSTNGRTFIVPAGFNASALNLSLADSQFTEIRKLSRIEIANAFGLTPAMIGEGTGNVEEDTLRYLQDTLLYKIKALEQEFTYKYLTTREINMGMKIKFNINTLLRTNLKTQQEIICELVKQGVYSVEYAREILGVRDLTGETVVFPSGQILLSDLINQNATWQKGNNKPQDNTGEGGEMNE